MSQFPHILTVSICVHPLNFTPQQLMITPSVSFIVEPVPTHPPCPQKHPIQFAGVAVHFDSFGTGDGEGAEEVRVEEVF